MLYVSLLVLLPLSMIFIHTMSLSWSAFIDIITDPRAVASYKVSFSTALITGLLNVFSVRLLHGFSFAINFPLNESLMGL